ncbi:unnamed protein product [Somion occarium]|uniref:Uncharacterized protein n=1 Tax=Somion occarium TaxID=3059160 RepID=A0ABP1DR19_9APHY
MLLPNPVLHTVNSSSEWPTVLRPITQLLHQQPPAFVSSAPRPPTSSSVQGLLEELGARSGALPAEFTCSNQSTPSAQAFRDAFNLILLTVASMRQVAGQESHKATEPTRSLMCFFVKSLAHLMRSSAVILTEEPFILPRLEMNENFLEQGKFEGHAELLISHLWLGSGASSDSFSQSVSESAAAAQSVNDAELGSDNADEDNQDEDDDEEGENDMREENPLRTGPSDVGLPFDAHMILGRGVRSYLILPILVVADYDNIISLMASTLYQRHVCGIRDPVVGLAFAKYGTVAQVFLGWVSYTDLETPVLHISRASKHASLMPSLGIYDLKNPWSACALAQFMLSLQHHFQEVAEATTAFHIRPYCWRLDHNDNEDESDASPSDDSLRNRIVLWCSHIDIDAPTTRPPSPSPPVEMSSSNLLKPPTITFARSHGSSAQDTVSEQAASVHPGSVMSCSGYNRQPARDLDQPKGSIASWLFERRSILASRRKIKPGGVALADETSKDELRDFEVKLDEFCKPFTIIWPREWKSKSDSLQQARDALWEQYLEFQNRHDVQIEDVDPEFLLILLDRFDCILWSSVRACASKVHNEPELKIRNVLELEKRSPWDVLLQLFYIRTTEEFVSPYVHLERKITLSVNPTARQLKEGKPVDDVKRDLVSLSRDIMSRCVVEMSGAMYETYNGALLSEVFAAHQRAQISNVLVQQLATNLSDAEFKTFILNRASEEPHEGICDAVVVTPFKVPKTDHSLESFIPFVGNATDGPEDPHFDYDAILKRKEENQKSQKTVSYKKTKVRMDIGVNEMKRLLKNPLRVSSDTRGVKSSNFSGKYRVPNHFHKDKFVLLPRLLAEYKKTDNEDKGLHQDFMYIVSATNFLASCGVYDYPVYGLTTNGSVGGVMIVWQSKKFKKVNVIERQLPTFDIAEPFQAYQFVTFLLKLRKMDDLLEELIDERRGPSTHSRTLRSHFVDECKDGCPQWAQKCDFEKKTTMTDKKKQQGGQE